MQIIEDLQVTFCDLPIVGVTTASGLISIQFSQRSQNRPVQASIPLANLTPAENGVLPCLPEGLRNKEIADRLSISVHTVEHYVSALLAKARCSDRLLLIAKAVQPVEGAAAKRTSPRYSKIGSVRRQRCNQGNGNSQNRLESQNRWRLVEFITCRYWVEAIS